VVLYDSMISPMNVQQEQRLYTIKEQQSPTEPFTEVFHRLHMRASRPIHPPSFTNINSTIG